MIRLEVSGRPPKVPPKPEIPALFRLHDVYVDELIPGAAVNRAIDPPRMRASAITGPHACSRPISSVRLAASPRSLFVVLPPSAAASQWRLNCRRLGSWRRPGAYRRRGPT
jgi:hypothetical protein